MTRTSMSVAALEATKNTKASAVLLMVMSLGVA